MPMPCYSGTQSTYCCCVLNIKGSKSSLNRPIIEPYVLNWKCKIQNSQNFWALRDICTWLNVRFPRLKISLIRTTVVIIHVKGCRGYLIIIVGIVLHISSLNPVTIIHTFSGISLFSWIGGALQIKIEPVVRASPRNVLQLPVCKCFTRINGALWNTSYTIHPWSTPLYHSVPVNRQAFFHEVVFQIYNYLKKTWRSNICKHSFNTVAYWVDKMKNRKHHTVGTVPNSIKWKTKNATLLIGTVPKSIKWKTKNTTLLEQFYTP